jgi:ABC-type nitrate/sulfonate/bicarbonate transport system permease component
MANQIENTSLHRLRDIIISFSAIPLILILWEFAAHFQFINTKLFPSFSSVCKALLDMAYSGELFTDVKASTARAVIGYFLGCFVGISIGIATGRIRVVEQLFGQVINMLRSFPPVALVPFAILWMGLAETSKYFLVFWGVVFPVWVNTHAGMTQIEQNYIRAAQLFGAKDIGLISNVLLPAALPHILAGMRVGIGLCFICVFVAEMSGAYEGVGFRISTSYMVFRVDKMLASLIVLGSMGALADRLFKLSVDIIFPWTRLSSNEQ